MPLLALEHSMKRKPSTSRPSSTSSSKSPAKSAAAKSPRAASASRAKAPPSSKSAVKKTKSVPAPSAEVDQHPVDVTPTRLMQALPLPLDWAEQRKVLGMS